MSLKEITKDRKLKKNFIVLLVLNSSLIAFAIFYTLYFNLTKGTEREIVCFVKDTFGFYCPGCGGSRSLTAFLKFDFFNSFILYPPIPIAALVVLSYDIMLVLTLIKKNTKITDSYRFSPFVFIALSIIINFSVRNILLLFGIDYIGDIIV